MIDWGITVWFPAWAGYFSLFCNVQTISGAHLAAYNMGTTGAFMVGI
jgi:hypothetical protein